MRKALCLFVSLALAFALAMPFGAMNLFELSDQAFASNDQQVSADSGSSGNNPASNPQSEPDPQPQPQPEPEPQPEPQPEPEPEPQPQPEPETKKDGISDIGIYILNTDICVGETSYPNRRENSITEKGGIIEFYAVCEWDDWSSTTNDFRLKWKSSDEAVFKVYNGRVQAVGDGVAELIAYVEAADNPNESYVEAKTTIVVAGQNDARYVTAIRIADKDGNAINDPFEITGDLATELYEFRAIVDVYDPASQTTQSFTTSMGQLPAELDGIGRVQWYVGDPAMSAVDNDSMPGLWRPVVYGVSSLYAYTNAGLGNAEVKTSITIQMRDPNGGLQDDDYYPQDSLTVLAYYEMYPPEDMRNDKDERFVINKKFSLDELGAMGLSTQTYTAFGNGSYFTMTGTGVPLATVLSEAGVNLDGVTTIAFGTADLIDRPVSYAYIFDTNRYYFPNIDMMSFAEAQQVFPILAFKSNLSKNASTEPDYSNMTEATRFRLLFGSTTEGGSSQYQIKWIHTLYVTLAGGPAVEPGDGGGGGGGPGTGGDSGSGAGSGDGGSQAGGNTSGIGPAEGGAATQSDSKAENVQQETTGGTEAQSGERGGSQGDTVGTVSESGNVNLKPENQQFTVYQVMNAHDSDIDKPLVPYNPYKPYAAPAGATVFVFGGFQALLWYRRQTRPLGTTVTMADASTEAQKE